MRFSTFFVFVCFVLLKGGPTSALATSTAQHYPLPTLNLHLAEKDHSVPDITIIDGSGPGDQSAFVFNDDGDDDDSNDVFVRKFKLLARSYSELSYEPPTGCSMNRSKAAPSFFGRVSYKYLQQRVLRV